MLEIIEKILVMMLSVFLSMAVLFGMSILMISIVGGLIIFLGKFI